VALGARPAANFDTADIGENKPVTFGAFTITGADAGNYSLVQPTGLTASITEADDGPDCCWLWWLLGILGVIGLIIVAVVLWVVGFVTSLTISALVAYWIFGGDDDDK